MAFIDLGTGYFLILGGAYSFILLMVLGRGVFFVFFLRSLSMVRCGSRL